MSQQLNFFENWRVASGVPVFLINQADGQKLLEVEQSLTPRNIIASYDTEQNFGGSFQRLSEQSLHVHNHFTWISSKAYDHTVDFQQFVGLQDTYYYPVSSESCVGGGAAWFEVWADAVGIHNVRFRTMNGQRWSAQENVAVFPPRGWAEWDVKRINLIGDHIDRVEITQDKNSDIITRLRIWTTNGLHLDSTSALTRDQNEERYYHCPQPTKQQPHNQKIITYSKNARTLDGKPCSPLPGNGILIGAIAQLGQFLESSSHNFRQAGTSGVQQEGKNFQEYIKFLAFGFQQGEEDKIDSYKKDIDFNGSEGNLTARFSHDGKYIVTHTEGEKHLTVWDVSYASAFKGLWIPAKLTESDRMREFLFMGDANWVVAWFDRWLLMWNLASKGEILQPTYQVSSPFIHSPPIGCQLDNNQLVCICGDDVKINITVWRFLSNCPCVDRAASISSKLMLTMGSKYEQHENHITIQTSIYGFAMEARNGVVMLQNGYTVILWKMGMSSPFELNIKLSLDTYLKSGSLSQGGEFLCLVVYRKGMSFVQLWSLEHQIPLQLEEFAMNEKDFEPWDCLFNKALDNPKVACWSTGSQRLIRIFHLKQKGDVLITVHGRIKAIQWIPAQDKLLTLHRGVQEMLDVLHIWDTINGVCLLQLEPQKCGVNVDQCMVSGDGCRILTWRQEWIPKSKADPFDGTITKSFSKNLNQNVQTNQVGKTSEANQKQTTYPSTLLIKQALEPVGNRNISKPTTSVNFEESKARGNILKPTVSYVKPQAAETQRQVTFSTDSFKTDSQRLGSGLEIPLINMETVSNERMIIVWQPEYTLKRVPDPAILRPLKKGSKILGVSFSYSNQYLFCLAHDGEGAENQIWTVMVKVSSGKVVWQEQWETELGIILGDPLARSNVKLSFSEDDKLAMVVLRANNQLQMKVQDVQSGRCRLVTQMVSLTCNLGAGNTVARTAVLPVIHEQPDQINIELLASQCVQASSLVGSEGAGFAAVLCAPEGVFVWGIGIKLAGPFVLQHADMQDRIASASTHFAEGSLSVVSCSEQGQVYLWLLHLSQILHIATHKFHNIVVRVQSTGKPIMSDEHPESNTKKGKLSKAMTLHIDDSGQLEPDNEYFYDIKDVKVQSQLLPHCEMGYLAHVTLSASKRHIIASNTKGQITIWYKVDTTIHMWVAICSAFSMQIQKQLKPRSQVLAMWSSVFLSRWTLLYVVAMETGSINHEIQVFVQSGFFLSTHEGCTEDISMAKILNTSFDLSDVIHGFQRVGTIGLPYEKLMMHQNKKLVIYHLAGFGRGDKTKHPSYLECTIPHDYRNQISSVQFSPSGNLIVCGTFTGDIFVLSSDDVFGRLSSLNYHNMLKEIKTVSNPSIGLHKTLKEIEQLPLTQEFFDFHMRQAGINMLTIVNMPDDIGNSLMMYLTVDRNQYLLAYIFKWADKYGAWLDLNLAAEGSSWGETIRSEAQNRPKPAEDYRGACIKLLVENMMVSDENRGWTISPRATAAVMPLLWPYLINYFPDLAIWLLKQANFTPESSDVVHMPSPQMFAVIPQSSQMGGRLQVDKHGFLTHWKPHQYWNKQITYEKEYVVDGQESQVVDKSLKKFSMKHPQMDTVEAPAESQVLLFHGAARRENKGILGPLLKAPHSIDEAFTYPAVLSVIRLKWKLFGEKVLFFEIVLYLILIQAFIVYTLLDLPYQQNPTKHLSIKDTFATVRFFLSTFLSFGGLFVSLLINFWKYGPLYLEFFSDIMESFKNRKIEMSDPWGTVKRQTLAIIEVLTISAVSALQIVFLVTYDKIYKLWICVILALRLSINEFLQLMEQGFFVWVQSGWNLFDASSYVLLYVVFFLEVSGNDDTLAQSLLISIEALFLWPKILSYLRAFKQTGPTIQMIIEVFKDAGFFIILLLIVMVGFGMAFFAIFGFYLTQDDSDFYGGDIKFDEIAPTMLAVLAFMGGDFSQQTYTTGAAWYWSMIMFVSFFFLLIIVLLNLLIALLGDSYSRIKDNEQARFQRGRAEIMDDLESSLFLIKMQRWEGSYVQLLVPKSGEDSDNDVNRKQQWEGSVQRTLTAIKDLPERVIGNLLKFLGVGFQKDTKRQGSVKLRRTEPKSLASRVKKIEADVDKILELVKKVAQKED